MKYFIDTEFLEGTQKKMFGQTKPTIDLISIGIVCEDGREYYAISKDFNLKEAWNRWQPEYDDVYVGNGKNYWIRDNVLKPIYDELEKKEVNNYKGFIDPYYELELDFTYKNFKRLIKKYGKSNKQIAEEIIKFVRTDKDTGIYFNSEPTFYGYYSDYDWVVFCWLFGKMIDLPTGFPMYCRDLKQELDSKADSFGFIHYKDNGKKFTWTLKNIQNFPSYPKQTNEHNALADARWNYELYKFLKEL